MCVCEETYVMSKETYLVSNMTSVMSKKNYIVSKKTQLALDADSELKKFLKTFSWTLQDYRKYNRTWTNWSKNCCSTSFSTRRSCTSANWRRRRLSEKPRQCITARLNLSNKEFGSSKMKKKFWPRNWIPLRSSTQSRRSLESSKKLRTIQRKSSRTRKGKMHSKTLRLIRWSKNRSLLTMITRCSTPYSKEDKTWSHLNKSLNSRRIKLFKKKLRGSFSWKTLDSKSWWPS